MRAFRAIRSAEQLLSMSTGFFTAPSSRTILFFPAKLFSSQANSADSRIDGSFDMKAVCTTLLAAEKEAAKALLTLFLKKQGLTNAVAARTINKSDLFIDHLVSRLHSFHKSRYPVGLISTPLLLLLSNTIFDSNWTLGNQIPLDMAGRELTTLEIRDALIPYLEALLQEHGDLIVDVVKNFPDPPVQEKTVGSVSQLNPTNSRKLKAMSLVSEINPAGKLHPHVLYLMELGMDLEQIKGIVQRYPAFAYYSSEGKIKPVVEFLLDLGVEKSNILTILNRRSQLFGLNVSDNIIPSMTFLESFGVDKKQWAKVIYRCPQILTFSKQKVKTTVEFLHEMGLSAESIGKILTRNPSIISCNVENNLRPTAEYFRSLRVDVAVLLHRCPQTFGLSIEANVKPLIQFFLEKGFSIEEVGIMISRFAPLCAYSLSKNLMPKWEFFLTMDCSKSTLVKYPQYFGFSLEERIKPRYARVKKCGVPLRLNTMLALSNSDFEKVLKKWTKCSLTRT